MVHALDTGIVSYQMRREESKIEQQKHTSELCYIQKGFCQTIYEMWLCNVACKILQTSTQTQL